MHFISLLFFFLQHRLSTKKEQASQVHFLPSASVASPQWAVLSLQEAKGASGRRCCTFLLIISGDNTGLGFWMMEISELLSSHCLSKRLCDKMLRHPFSLFFSLGEMSQADKGLKSTQISSILPLLSPCCPNIPSISMRKTNASHDTEAL